MKQFNFWRSAYLASSAVPACNCCTLSRGRLAERHVLRSTSSIILLIASVVPVWPLWLSSVRVCLIGTRIWVPIRRLGVLRIAVRRYRRKSNVCVRRSSLVIWRRTVVLFAWRGRVLRFLTRWIATALVLVRHLVRIDRHGECLRRCEKT